jgi:hypothetical protein
LGLLVEGNTFRYPETHEALRLRIAWDAQKSLENWQEIGYLYYRTPRTTIILPLAIPS